MVISVYTTFTLESIDRAHKEYTTHNGIPYQSIHPTATVVTANLSDFTKK